MGSQTVRYDSSYFICVLFSSYLLYLTFTSAQASIINDTVHNISCGAFINESLKFTGDKHYYSFINKHDNLQVTITTCPRGYYSTFDTDLTISDPYMNHSDYVDGGCPDYRASLTRTWSQGTYIIMLDDYNYNSYNFSTGQYYMELTCTTKSPTSSPTPRTIMTDRFISVELSMNFTQSESYCQEVYGTHLATILTKSEVSQVRSLCESSWNRECWIGLNKIDNNNEYVYTSGANYNPSIVEWYSSNKTSVIMNNCVGIGRHFGYKWFSWPCNMILDHFICDASTQSPTSQTTSPATFTPTSATIPPTTYRPTLPTLSPTLSPTQTTRFHLADQQWGMTFSNAETYCQDTYGTHLASIYTQSDIEEAKEICKSRAPWYGC